jgi:hypothetical protein
MKDSGRRWLIAAVGLFVFLLVGWVLLALQLNSALAGPLPFGPGLMSQLRADYRADEGGRSVALISLSILDEAMQALGLTEEEASAAHESVELAVVSPSRRRPPWTSMARRRSPPPRQSEPASDQHPDGAPTNTPLLRRTPEPTETDRPTRTPGGPNHAGAPPPLRQAESDTEDPEVDSYTVNPTPGLLDPGVCTIDATVRIIDEGPSSGIATSDVGMKYEDPGGGYEYSYNMTLDSGGPDGFGGWDATYTGSITFTDIDISGVVGSLKLASPMLTWEDVDVWFIIEDLAGNDTYVLIGTYRLENDCD